MDQPTAQPDATPDAPLDKKARRKAYLKEYENRPERRAYRRAFEKRPDQVEKRNAADRRKRLMAEAKKLAADMVAKDNTIRIEMTVRVIHENAPPAQQPSTT